MTTKSKRPTTPITRTPAKPTTAKPARPAPSLPAAPTQVAPAPTRSALDAAAAVLADGRARSCRELIGAMAHRHLWSSPAVTPHATLNAALHRDLARHGAASRFRKVGPGRFALADTATAASDPAPASPATEPAAPPARALPPLALTDAQRVLLGYDEIEDRMPLWDAFDGKRPLAEDQVAVLVTDVRHLPGRGEANPSVAAAATRLRAKVAAYLRAAGRAGDAEAVLR